jgi:cytidine deaminase
LERGARRRFQHAMTPPAAASGDADWAVLAAAARAASAQAYCPYSRFPVGAAVRSADGRVFAGCNVENASFGLTVCAERNAVFQAVAAGARALVALALYTPTPKPVTPCGACRQVLAEFGVRELVCVAQDGASVHYALADLLPHAFGLAP